LSSESNMSVSVNSAELQHHRDDTGAGRGSARGVDGDDAILHLDAARLVIEAGVGAEHRGNQRPRAGDAAAGGLIAAFDVIAGHRTAGNGLLPLERHVARAFLDGRKLDRLAGRCQR